MAIKDNLREIKSNVPAHVTLVAVSKTWPIECLMEAYDAGQRVFGENKIQEMADKWQQLPKDIQWHMIGHVQTNKVKAMAGFVELIHGIDSLKLLAEVDKHAAKNQRIINCLFQIHIAREENKFGLDENELATILSSQSFAKMENIMITGLMGMASYTDDTIQIKKEFTYLKSLFEKFPPSNNYQPKTLSMGMSGDYPLAIDCGSNMVRIGSSIFGNRSTAIIN